MDKIKVSEIAPTTALHFALVQLDCAFIPGARREAVAVGLLAELAVLLDVVFAK